MFQANCFVVRSVWQQLGKPLLHVGPMKGTYLDHAVQRSSPSLVLELGSYLGYSAVRALAPLAKLCNNLEIDLISYIQSQVQELSQDS